MSLYISMHEAAARLDKADLVLLRPLESPQDDAIATYINVGREDDDEGQVLVIGTAGWDDIRVLESDDVEVTAEGALRVPAFDGTIILYKRERVRV